MDKTAKVFVINSTTHDYSTAEKYGSVVNVTEGKVPIFKSDAIIGMLKQKLSDFSKDDYLLVSGPALVIIYAVSIVSNKFDEFKIIVFDAKQQCYVVRHINKANL